MPKNREPKSLYPTSWDLSPLFPSDDDPSFNDWLEKIRAKIDEFASDWKGRADYLTDPKLLAAALKKFEDLANFPSPSEPGHLDFYFGLRASQETENPKLKAKNSLLSDFDNELADKLRFFTHRLARVPAIVQKQFLADGGLANYRHWLERLFAEAKYLLSEPEERVASYYGAPAYGHWRQLLETLLGQEKREILVEPGRRAVRPFNSFSSLFSSIHQEVRDEAARATNEVLSKHVQVAEAELNAILEGKKINDKLRRVARSDETRHLADDIETPVVDAMLAAVEKNYDLSTRYYQFKSRLLGLPKMAYHERLVPVGQFEEKFSYDQAVELVRAALGRWDKEIEAIFMGLVQAGRIDVYPRPGKTGGAFCASDDLNVPTYILLNFDGELRDVMTLAHEVGHGVNNELIRKRQTALNFGTPISTAEVASTLFESILFDDLLNKMPVDKKLTLLVKRLDDEVSTIFRQVAGYRFEQELHRQFRAQGYLSKEEIGTLFQKHMSNYMGPAVEQSPGSENWWVHWNHFRYYFYIYSYASGHLIAEALYHRLKADPKFIGSIKEFLSAGLSASPQEIFTRLGISIADPKFWLAGLLEFKNRFDRAEGLARELGKIK